MKTEKLIKELSKAHKYFRDFTQAKECLFLLIKPYIDNDTETPDDSICVDYMPDSGFAFMIDQGGVSVKEMIGRISDLKKGEKIRLSTLTLYI